MTEGKVDSYNTKSLEFSPSKVFFQHQKELLQKIEFISTMTIDIHFKYTFQEIQPKYFIEWWEFEWLNIDHEIIDQWIIYKIGFLNPKFQNIQHLLLNLKKNSLDNPSIWPLLIWFFGWLIVFFILLWLYNYTICKILFRLNLMGALILLFFYGFKKIKSLYKKIIETKNVEYWGFVARYTNQTDALMLSPDVIESLKKLWENYRITKFCYTGNCIYLLQDIHDKEWKRLDNSSKLYSEQEKAALQQKTLDYLHQNEFLSKFMSE